MSISASTIEPVVTDANSQSLKYLTFALGDEEYGLDLLKVREIIGMMHITPVPRMPSFFRGVINLRGKVILVIDLRVRLGLPPIERTDDTCIIIVELPQGDRKINIGMVVDHVADVVEITSADIEEPPSFGPEVSTEFILGIGKGQGSLKILLDIQRILEFDEVLTTKVSLGNSTYP